MFKDLLSSRWIQGGLVFFVVVLSGSLLYSWHVRRTTEAELERHAQFLQGPENKNWTSSVQSVNVPTENETLGETPEKIHDLQMSNDADVSPIDEASESADVMDAFLPDDFVSEEVPPEDVPVSPYGFGPYPEVPEAFIQKVGVPPWFNVDPSPGNKEKVYDLPENTKRGVEIIYRVLLGLWKQGDESIISGIHDSTTGLVYPLYENTIYISLSRTKEGKATRIRTLSDPSVSITAEERQRLQDGGEAPAGIRVLDLDSAGVDPSQFLNIR